VKDLEVELEVTKQKNKETLEQAIILERERVTQMQWDMDELRRKCCEMESKLKFEQVGYFSSPPISLIIYLFSREATFFLSYSETVISA
jgi:hypothetical protein